MRESLHAYCLRSGETALLSQWDAGGNGTLTPQSIPYGSKRKVWWTCEKGHRWQATVTARTSDHTGCPVCAGKRPDPGVNDLATLFPHLAQQWDAAGNGSLTPDQVLPGSHRKVWWQCSEGHRWQAIVKSRVSGTGCPVCQHRALAAGETDLATRFPDLAAQWHPSRNGPLTPRDVFPGTQRKVWWQCEKGHVWQARVSSRAQRGAGCPFCAGKQILPGENDLATLFPAVAREWHPARNGELRPEEVSPYSNRKVWWQCPQGHAYQAVVAGRTAGRSGCPYCAGRKVLAGFNDLATLDPHLAREWHPTLNQGLGPEQVTPGSHKRVWWRCPEGHVWKAVVYSRARGKRCGCPVCAGKVSEKNLARYRDPPPTGRPPRGQTQEPRTGPKEKEERL